MKANYNIADAEWEWYIGSLYSKLIENIYKGKINCVVELAPGFRHKIANVLSNFGFDGTLYVIDSSQDVLNYVENKYKEFIPRANIICINKKFGDSFDDLPQNIDLFLTNHCVDDLIISQYFNDCYSADLNDEELQEKLIKLWDQLNDDKKSQIKIIDDIKNTFYKFFNTKKIKLIIMGQYKSNLYFLGKSNSMNRITYKCFNEIKKMIFMDNDYIDRLLNFYPFGNDKRYMGKYLLNNTQNSKNWVVGRFNDEIPK